MHIASALRHKRDEIAATIAAWEARIDAARRDLAALDQATRLFDLEAGRDETGVSWDRDRLVKTGGLLGSPREANEKQQALDTGRLTPPAEGMQDLEHQIPGKVAHTSTWTGPEEVPEEFFYLDWP
jgi:hypothetical protein